MLTTRYRGSGQAMFLIAWLLLLALLFSFFHTYLDSQERPNRGLAVQTGPQEVVLKQNRSHHYIMPGSINGQPVVFFVDTGASMVSIPKHIADRLDLRMGLPMQASTAGGTVTVYLTRIAELRFGTIRLRNVKASINPATRSPYILLGMSALKQLEFSQKDGQLIIKQR